ncbi:MAG: MFS transporter [Rothia sp. (in: high G+C Gram-positive bacteria)]|nr:MFS transporter [Rothia sp. (in: high G+C Gram-positive bacteria)]
MRDEHTDPRTAKNMAKTFRSLGVFNYRIWFLGALISNIGTWMQRTAQDWLVFNDLSDHDSTQMGIVIALQFAPPLLLTPYAGVLADRGNRRKILLLTQSLMGLLALGLGLLVLLGAVEIWHVYLFALALGVVGALDAPVRTTFVSELVNDKDLPNAVALNSLSFNTARMIGPALAGLLVVAVGTGPVFLINTLTFVAMILAINTIKENQLRHLPRSTKANSRMRDGLTYLKNRPDISIVMVSAFLIGTFGLNTALNIAAMATTEFGQGAGEFGALNSVVAIGSVAGTLLAARRDTPRLRFMFGSCFAFGITTALAALAPTLWVFALTLIPLGLAALTIITSANAYVQVTTDPQMCGRIMSIYMAVFIGGTPIGSPLVGMVNDIFGARWGLGVASASGFIAALIGLVWVMRYRHLHFSYDRESRTKLVLRPRPASLNEELDEGAHPVTAAIDIQQPR